MTATTNVAGANRTANLDPNEPACIANSFRSTIGPTTRNASRAVSENWLSDAATNASASEQMDSITASRASAMHREARGRTRSPAATGAARSR